MSRALAGEPAVTLACTCRIPSNFREPAYPSPFASRMAFPAESRCHGSQLRRSRGAPVSRRRRVALEVPLRELRERRAGRGGGRPNARLRLPSAAARVAVASGFACAAWRRGVRPVHDGSLRRRRSLGLPVRLRPRGDRERRAPAIGPGAFVRPLPWRFDRLNPPRLAVVRAARGPLRTFAMASEKATQTNDRRNYMVGRLPASCRARFLTTQITSSSAVIAFAKYQPCPY